jgi:hypothetical protein
LGQFVAYTRLDCGVVSQVHGVEQLTHAKCRATSDGICELFLPQKVYPFSVDCEGFLKAWLYSQFCVIRIRA